MSRTKRDQGMTLIELLVTIAVLGLIATVIAAAVTVVLRQSPETIARADSARWEQNLGTWLPADLSSAEFPADSDGDGIPDDPSEAIDFAGYEPCGTAECTWGDNVAHFSWSDGGVDVDVSYRYGEDPGPYELRRVECRNGASCSSITLVRDMPGPGSGGEPPIAVTFPPAVTWTDESGAEVLDTSGRRVSVSVTGANGIDLLSFSGGGTERVDLAPAAIQPPEFLQARSGCGGPITLIVDESGSLTSSDATQVRAGVQSFVEVFAGTPTLLQIVGFNADARVLGSTTNWNSWYDLSNQATVDGLLGTSSPINSLGHSGATNWEDAFYRTFYREDGQTVQATASGAFPASELVVFFTDGMPTYHRDEQQTGAENPELDSDDLPDRYDANNTTTATYTQFDPKAWYRAYWLLQQQATRVIGVGVGTAFGMAANLDRDTTLDDDVIDSDWAAPYETGSGYSDPRAVPAEVALGYLIEGTEIHTYDGVAPAPYVKVEYDGGWDPLEVQNADVLTTTDFSQFGGALESIALAECGGTLTVQTRQVSDESPLYDTVQYQVSGDTIDTTVSSTSAVSKSAVFDIADGGGTAVDIELKPTSLAATDFEASHWECRSRNVAIGAPKLTSAGATAEDGVNLTVEANEAVSCILWVDEA
ncbi:MAG: prepilin-type N-terminal cleavage/methylation domain-containing protein [Ilumatobacter fluminis]|uniref:prepilin-type N-terminal cleavage/methylation domain-containing protein n=1 Tax=Ilumatobacter fluminis TaxID=467091 RepID=UPI0032EEFDFE